MNRLGTTLASLGALLTLFSIYGTVSDLDSPLELGVIGPALVVIGVGTIAHARRKARRP